MPNAPRSTGMNTAGGPSASAVDAAWLRSLPSLSGSAPRFDPEDLPADPVALFRSWIAEAVRRGVPEPHAMTLATVDPEGMPDARTLILKGVGDDGWAFAGPRRSVKATQLAARPVAALSFWWQPLVRAVRVRGRVCEASPSERAADLAARSPAARAGIGAEDWMLWRVIAERVEFWQGAADRDHLRVVFLRDENGWAREARRAEARADEEER